MTMLNRTLKERHSDLSTQLEELLLKERQYRNNKTKETNRYLFGAIGVGLLSIIVSLLLNII